MTVAAGLPVPPNRRKELRRTNAGALAWQDAPRIFVDDYGAAGDGSTNDTAAIDLAMDAAYALATTANKKVVLAFNGDKTYVVARRVAGQSGLGGIYLRRGVSLEGNGATLQLSTAATTTCAFIAAKSPLAVDKSSTLTTNTAITGNVAVGDVQVTVASTTGFATGDDVFLRINDNAYDSAETKDPMFAKVLTVDDGTHLTLDRPIPVAMTVASTATANKIVYKLHEPLEGGFIRNFVLINGETGTANAEYGIDLRYTRNLVVENVTAEHPGTGIVVGGYNEGLICRNLRLRKCDKQASHTAKGRAIDLWNPKNVRIEGLYAENFEGSAIVIESYGRGVVIDGLHVVNTHASRVNASVDLLSILQDSDVDLRNVTVEGNGSTPLVGSGGTTNTVTWRNLTIKTATQLKGGLALKRVTGVLRIGTTAYQEVRVRTIPFRILASMSSVTLSLPTGLYRQVKVYVSSTTGINNLYVQNTSGNGADIHTSLVSGGMYEHGNSGLYGADTTFNNVDAKRLSITTDGTVPAGAFGMVEIEYHPTATDDGSQGRAQLVLPNPPTYAVTNVSADRTYDASSTTTAEVANVLGTLIADLKASGWIA